MGTPELSTETSARKEPTRRRIERRLPHSASYQPVNWRFVYFRASCFCCTPAGCRLSLSKILVIVRSVRNRHSLRVSARRITDVPGRRRRHSTRRQLEDHRTTKSTRRTRSIIIIATFRRRRGAASSGRQPVSRNGQIGGDAGGGINGGHITISDIEHSSQLVRSHQLTCKGPSLRGLIRRCRERSTPGHAISPRRIASRAGATDTQAGSLRLGDSSRTR